MAMTMMETYFHDLVGGLRKKLEEEETAPSRQLQQQSQQLAALNTVGKTVAASLEVSEVLSSAVSGVYEILRVELSAVLMLDSGRLDRPQARKKTRRRNQIACGF